MSISARPGKNFLFFAQHENGLRLHTSSRALGEHEEIQNLPDGGVMAGGVGGYATFCEPINMHFTSLGEPSRLIIDGEFIVVNDIKMLPPDSESVES